MRLLLMKAALLYEIVLLPTRDTPFGRSLPVEPTIGSSPPGLEILPAEFIQAYPAVN